MKKRIAKWVGKISKNFQGENKREIDLSFYDEILGIFLGFIYVRFFIETSWIETDVCNFCIDFGTTLMLISSMVVLGLLVIAFHSNNKKFSFNAISVVVGGFGIVLLFSFLFPKATFIRGPERLVLYVTFICMITWYTLRFGTQLIVEYLQNYPIESNFEDRTDNNSKE